MSASRNFARPARFAAIAPYLWMAVFFLVPFFFILKISLSQTAISQPPYEPVFDLTQGLQSVKEAAAQLSAENFRLLVSDSLYVLSYLRSIVVAAISTLILVLLGYPIAYGMSRLSRGWQVLAMLAVIVPFWTSFLIRIYAWINILQRDGLLNDVLVALKIVSAPLVWLSTDTAMYIGIVYSYLPFMVLPLFATLSKMDAVAARGGRRSRLLAPPGVLAGHLAVVIARRRRRRPALLHSDHRRVRDSRPARRLRPDDDRPDVVGRVLHQPRLAGGVGDRGGSAARPAGAAACL